MGRDIARRSALQSLLYCHYLRLNRSAIVPPSNLLQVTEPLIDEIYLLYFI